MSTQPIFLVMPEWQGSSAARSMLLVDGADHLRGDLPSSARVEVPVPTHAGDALGTPVARLSSILAARDSAREALRAHTGPAITLGGDCASTLAGIEHAARVASESGETLAVLWFDAHPDLQHPSTSPSGAASGMALRHALGDGVADLVSRHPVDASQVLLIGTRDFDPDEQDAMAQFGLRRLQETTSAAAVHAFLSDIGATKLFIHIDLDVLDPAEFTSVHVPVPFGLSVASLTDLIRAAVSATPLAGATISEFAPADDEMANNDAPTVLRVLAALTSGAHE